MGEFCRWGADARRRGGASRRRRHADAGKRRDRRDTGCADGGSAAGGGGGRRVCHSRHGRAGSCEPDRPRRPERLLAAARPRRAPTPAVPRTARRPSVAAMRVPGAGPGSRGGARRVCHGVQPRAAQDRARGGKGVTVAGVALLVSPAAPTAGPVADDRSARRTDHGAPGGR